jgi:predicted neutral ceramidase superfamily lipid hydrolase
MTERILDEIAMNHQELEEEIEGFEVETERDRVFLKVGGVRMFEAKMSSHHADARLVIEEIRHDA